MSSSECRRSCRVVAFDVLNPMETIGSESAKYKVTVEFLDAGKQRATVYMPPNVRVNNSPTSHNLQLQRGDGIRLHNLQQVQARGGTTKLFSSAILTGQPAYDSDFNRGLRDAACQLADFADAYGN